MEPLEDLAVKYGIGVESLLLACGDAQQGHDVRWRRNRWPKGWVRYVSRSVPLRPDLVPLAEQLTAAEPAGVTWRADGVGSLVTRMRPEPQGKSDLDPAMISRTIVSYLKSAPPAWDPFRRDGALIPARMRRLIR